MGNPIRINGDLKEGGIILRIGHILGRWLIVLGLNFLSSELNFTETI